MKNNQKNTPAKTLLLSSALALLSLSVSAQTEVTDYTPGVTQEGITYLLPRTELVVRVTATVIHYKPGDFRQYAERYLRLNDLPRVAYDSWKIDDVKIYSIGVPDVSKAFSVKLRQKTSAPLVSLTRDGILLSVNAESRDANTVPAAPAPVRTDNNLNSRDYMTEEILAAGSTSKMAELTAAEIYDIRESRSSLAKGEADNMPKDGEQLKLMMKGLDTQEKALLQLFKGTQTSETRTFDFAYVPTGDKKDVLFRFSSKLGPVAADDLAGEPVYISILDKHTVAEPQPSDKKKKEENDIRYNVPSQAEIKIYSLNTAYASGIFPIAQFGNVEHLGAELFNKKMETQVYFDPSTGGIAKLKLPTPEK